MPMGRPKADLVLSEDERAQLSPMARSRSIPAALSVRARVVLAADGAPNSEIAQRLQLSQATVAALLHRAAHQRALRRTAPGQAAQH